MWKPAFDMLRHDFGNSDEKIPASQVNKFAGYHIIGATPQALDVSEFLLSKPSFNRLIANSSVKSALALIRRQVDVNQYDLEYGNCPLLISISKGWNHRSTDIPYEDDKEGVISAQKNVIEALLATPNIDVNCINLQNGMTPLHIACLRGDDPDLI
jgi:ankyrin repeat protein